MDSQGNLYSLKKKYINFKIDGRLFPSWVLANFKTYALPDVLKKEEKPRVKETHKRLHLYQRFLSQYLDYKSPYRDILIYHGLGSGKTASAINIYNALYNYTPGWNVFILIKAALHNEPWLSDIKSWLSDDEYEFRFKNIIFIHYDAPNADKQFQDAIRKVDSSKKSLYIIDEAHNFIRNVYSNISSGFGRRAQVIYDYIIQDKKESEGTRVVCLTGTPAINKPFELALLFNLLRPGTFPRSENEFNYTYISTTSNPTINPNTKNMFQRRILGLVSFYLGVTPELYASKKIHNVDVEMSPYQTEIYKYYEEIEDNMRKRARHGSGGQEMYRSYTRQASNFVFPSIDQQVTGEGRPRPGKFRLTEREANKIDEGKTKLKLEKKTEKYMNVTQYVKALELYVTSFDSYIKRKYRKDVENKHTIKDDIASFIKDYDGDFWKFNDNSKKKSFTYSAMFSCSPKMVNIIFNIMKSKGPVVVYSNYVMMEGLEIFKIYLKYFGFHSAMKDSKDKSGDGPGYVEYHGGIKDRNERSRALKMYNEENNKYGKIIKIIMISPAGTEGISLNSVRQIHIMEPYWNEVRIIQIIGRGIRQSSHKFLPKDERHVDVYRYRSTRESGKITTDQYIEDLAQKKDRLLQSFLETLKQAAIDCELSKKQNMIHEKYTCFQFEEPSLFEPQVGPAFKDDIHDDIQLDNGLNSMNSEVVKIRVKKIQAVKLLSSESETPKYSAVDDYWYYPSSGVVYDYELHYAIGKVSFDESGIPGKLNKETYIIDRLIPIPMLSK
jgi:superfamily II DNA or RNA helicase